VKLYTHFAVVGFSNSYLLGPDEGGDAILIDPGVMDLELLNLIENNNFYVKHILVTTPHEAHVQGLKTILKIYEATIHSGASSVLDFPCFQVYDGDTINLTGFDITVFNISGHSEDSIVYKLEDALFTGDAFGAGLVGDSPNPYTVAILKSTILKKIAPLDDNLLIFPGHGPPSTLEAERKFNPGFTKNTDPED